MNIVKEADFRRQIKSSPEKCYLFFGDEVVITKSEMTTRLVRLKDEGFYSKIRMKKFI